MFHFDHFDYFCKLNIFKSSNVPTVFSGRRMCLVSYCWCNKTPQNSWLKTAQPNIQYLFFSFWLTSLCMTDARSIHSSTNDSILFLFMSELIFHGIYVPHLLYLYGWTCFQGENRDTDVGTQWGGEERVGQTESSVDIYTLLCAKQAAGGNLLCSTRSSAWCSVMT